MEEQKLCPFLDEPCIGGECNLHISITQQKVILGTLQTIQKGMCVFPALSMIMSRPQMPPPQQQGINLPGLGG